VAPAAPIALLPGSLRRGKQPPGRKIRDGMSPPDTASRHRVNLDLPPANHSSTGSERENNRLATWLWAAAPSNIDQGPERAPPQADLATARRPGRRGAETTVLLFVRASRVAGVREQASAMARSAFVG